MAAVGYTALTFELMLLGRRQVLTLTEQVATQREELEQNKAALERQREEAARQVEHAEEARDAARRTFLESVYARVASSTDTSKTRTARSFTPCLSTLSKTTSTV